jgi:hypothetical protein
MNSFTPIWLEWNCYNGFVFQFFNIESYKPINMDASLFGISLSKRFLYIDILWMNFKVFDNTGVD